MAWTRGDVVLIPFPFSDLTAVKTRQAIIVKTPAFQTVRQELLLAYVTSQMGQPHPFLDYLLIDWRAAGLLKPSLMQPRVAVVRETLIQFSWRCGYENSAGIVRPRCAYRIQMR